MVLRHCCTALLVLTLSRRVVATKCSAAVQFQVLQQALDSSAAVMMLRQFLKAMLHTFCVSLPP
jgi:hypothetical protein